MPITVLYADDDIEDRELFVDVLRELDPNIRVILATNGVHAIETLNGLQTLPDAVFLDFNMPLMTGLQCTTTLRSESRYQALPIVIYSTTSNDAESKAALAAGADKFLVKGNTLDCIKKDMARVLGLPH